ncbi:MAG TPA: alpha/beta hydrolase [Patescibacteria group bacterium]|nr:alpha/beta hydrolase [Patescibacteria group bacterium]
MQKIFIKNRKDQKVAVIFEEAETPKGLTFVMHGLGGYKEQPHLEAITESFKENKYTVVRFDTTNTIGESEGNFEDATVTNYYEDLEDVIKWSGTQKWYVEPFVLVGHSLGGISTALFAENYPEKVKALAPISTVVSGALSVEAHKKFEPEEFKNWEKTGWLEAKSQSKPGVVKKLKWSHIADRLKYDLLPQANKLTMPVLLIVGENDIRTPLDHQKILYNALLGPKELHIIKGSPHTFRDPAHLEELKNIFNQWIKKII